MPELLPYPHMAAIRLEPAPVDLLSLVDVIRATIVDPGHINRFRLSEAQMGAYSPADGPRDARRDPLPGIPYAPGVVGFPGSEGPGYWRPNTFQPLGTPASCPYVWDGGVVQAWWISYTNFYRDINEINGSDWIYSPYNIGWEPLDGLIRTNGADSRYSGGTVGTADGCPIYPWPYPYPAKQTQNEYHQWAWGLFGVTAGIPKKTMSGLTGILAGFGLLAWLGLISRPPDCRPRKS